MHVLRLPRRAWPVQCAAWLPVRTPPRHTIHAPAHAAAAPPCLAGAASRPQCASARSAASLCHASRRKCSGAGGPRQRRRRRQVGAARQ
eukprot:362741-Chlamydomonas_euryale.AAC.3